jgi:hypothetical protein
LTNSPNFMTVERKVVAIPATTYESVRLGQLFRVEGFVYVLVAMARSQGQAIAILEPKRGSPRQAQGADTH